MAELTKSEDRWVMEFDLVMDGNHSSESVRKMDLDELTFKHHLLLTRDQDDEPDPNEGLVVQFLRDCDEFVSPKERR